ncbi:cytochrome C oxidase assembly protein [Oceanobacillus picturae]|uniref:Cytochrome C oxidase assembly protein n=1 Tax=Oceanobacillus picturae TaxID=171693 RepID=A0A0U9H700_9BACI|nr:hypothetical protein [Oceanobacillus picturae]GAQ17577.1 cytochrome C oxidase assembly protein [Oceanobacillus picturae]
MRLTKKQKCKYLLFYPLATGIMAYLFQSLLAWSFVEISKAIGLTTGFFIFWWGWALIFPRTLPDNQKTQKSQSKKKQIVRGTIFYVIILVLVIIIIWLGESY